MYVCVDFYLSACAGIILWYHSGETKRKHTRILGRIFARPVSGTIPWRDIESLFTALGGEITEREGSRVEVFLFAEIRVYHRPHPQPETDKGAVASVRMWLEKNGVSP